MAADGPNKLTTEFISTHSGDGAQKTAEGIKQVKAAAQEAAPAQDELNKKGKEGAEVDKEGVRTKKDFVDIMKVLRTEFPLLARAIDFVRNPITLAATAVTLLVGAFKAMRDESRKAMEAAEESLRGADRVATGLGKMRDIAAQMAQTEESFRKTLKAIEDGAGEAAKQLGLMNKEIERQKRFADEQTDAQMATEIQAIDDAEKGGRMGAADAIRARGAARQRGADRRRANEDSARNMQIQSLGRTKFDAEGEASKMEIDLEGAREDVVKARRAERVEERAAALTIKQAAAIIAKAQEANEKNEREIAAAQDRAKEFEKTHPAQAQRELEFAERGRRAIEANMALIDQKDTEIDVANEKLEKRKGATASAQGRVSDLEGGIRSRRSSVDGINAQMDDLRSENRLQQSLGPVRAQQRAVEDAKTNREAGESAAAEARKYFELDQQLSKEILEVMRLLGGNTEAARREVANLKAQFLSKVQQMDSQSAAAREQ